MPPKRKARDASEEPEEEPSEESSGDDDDEEEEDPAPKRVRKAGASKVPAPAPRRRGAVKAEEGSEGKKAAAVAKAKAKDKPPRSSTGAGGAGGAGSQPEPAADPSLDPDRAKLAEQFDAEVAKLADHPHVKSVSAKDLDRLVADVMRVMLFRRHKDGAPVPRSDLTTLVSKAYKDKRQLGPHVVALAQRRFLSSLGMEMQALDKVKRSEADVKKMVAAAGADKSSAADRSYVLRSALPARLRTAFVDRPEDAPLRGLAVTVLSLIAIAGDGGLPEDTLWTQLASLGAPKGIKTHPALGDADAALEVLVKQRYVQRSKAQGPDGERKVLELAENALAEVGMKRISDFIAATMKSGRGAPAAGGDDD